MNASTYIRNHVNNCQCLVALHQNPVFYGHSTITHHNLLASVIGTYFQVLCCYMYTKMYIQSLFSVKLSWKQKAQTLIGLYHSYSRSSRFTFSPHYCRFVTSLCFVLYMKFTKPCSYIINWELESVIHTCTYLCGGSKMVIVSSASR